MHRGKPTKPARNCSRPQICLDLWPSLWDPRSRSLSKSLRMLNSTSFNMHTLQTHPHLGKLCMSPTKHLAALLCACRQCFPSATGPHKWRLNADCCGPRVSAGVSQPEDRVKDLACSYSGSYRLTCLLQGWEAACSTRRGSRISTVHLPQSIMCTL